MSPSPSRSYVLGYAQSQRKMRRELSELEAWLVQEVEKLRDELDDTKAEVNRLRTMLNQ